MSVNIRKKRGKLYLDIYENGKRKWESLHLALTDDKTHNKEAMRLAEICRAKRELQVVSGEWGLTDPIAAKQTLYGYIKEMESSGDYSKRIHCVLKHLKDYPGGSTIQIGQVNNTFVESFQEFLLKRIAQNTAWSYSVAIRQALNKAVKNNIILKNPAREVKSIKRREADKIYLTTEEVQKLADTEPLTEAEKDIRKAFIFACYTGLRISDLMTITWGDIEHSPPLIAKRQKKTDVKVFIPLHKTAWSVINDGSLHNHKELIFTWLQVIKNNKNHFLTKWTKRAGIEKRIGWHTARHTFAVQSLESGAEIYTVSKLLGHTNISMTEVYTKATDKMKREAVDALPEIKMGSA